MIEMASTSLASIVGRNAENLKNAGVTGLEHAGELRPGNWLRSAPWQAGKGPAGGTGGDHCHQ